MTGSTPTTRWPFLDLVRAGAALLVMLGHARGYFFPEFATLTSPGPLTKAFYLATGLAREGVVLFFLVSGFLVGGTAWEAFAAGRFEPVRYFVNRFVRVYLVFLPALALTIVLQVIGTTRLGGLPAAPSQAVRTFAEIPEQPLSWSFVTCHLACLQGVWCSAAAANAPLWTLGYEWLLYLVAPLALALAFAPVAGIWRGVALALLAATLFNVLPSYVLWSLIAMWVIGAAAHRLAARWPAPTVVGLAGLAVTVMAIALGRGRIWPTQAADLLAAAGFAVAMTCPAVMQWSPAPRVVRFLADCSYSLYAIHLPLLMLLYGMLTWLLGPLAPGLTFGGFVRMAVTFVMVIAAAGLFAHLTERHTRRLQTALLAPP